MWARLFWASRSINVSDWLIIEVRGLPYFTALPKLEKSFYLGINPIYETLFKILPTPVASQYEKRLSIIIKSINQSIEIFLFFINLLH